MQAESIKSNRIQFLDGLRGIAILAVIGFHAYIAYPDRLPFGDKFGVIPLRLGWQGIELFFLISGFVILMTLERSQSLLEFGWRRWSRLFPAMFVATILSFMLYKKPLIDMVPGLTFINPSLLHSLLRIEIHSLNNVFWTLYIEVAFYAVFGALYFYRGPWFAIAGIFFLFSVSALASLLPIFEESLLGRIVAAARWIGVIYFGWFASGALFYQFFKSSDWKFYILAIAAALCAVLSIPYPLVEQLGLVCVVILFAVAMLDTSLRSILAWRPLAFVGVISYPLYLLHLPILDTMQWACADILHWAPSFVWPWPPLTLSLLLAWLVYRFIEKPINRIVHQTSLRKNKGLSTAVK